MSANSRVLSQKSAEWINHDIQSSSLLFFLVYFWGQLIYLSTEIWVLSLFSPLPVQKESMDESSSWKCSPRPTTQSEGHQHLNGFLFFEDDSNSCSCRGVGKMRNSEISYTGFKRWGCQREASISQKSLQEEFFCKKIGCCFSNQGAIFNTCCLVLFNLHLKIEQVLLGAANASNDCLELIRITICAFCFLLWKVGKVLRATTFITLFLNIEYRKLEQRDAFHLVFGSLS